MQYIYKRKTYLTYASKGVIGAFDMSAYRIIYCTVIDLIIVYVKNDGIDQLWLLNANHSDQNIKNIMN